MLKQKEYKKRLRKKQRLFRNRTKYLDKFYKNFGELFPPLPLNRGFGEIPIYNNKTNLSPDSTSDRYSGEIVLTFSVR